MHCLAEVLQKKVQIVLKHDHISEIKLSQIGKFKSSDHDYNYHSSLKSIKYLSNEEVKLEADEHFDKDSTYFRRE